MNTAKYNLFNTVGVFSVLLLIIWSLTPVLFRNLPFVIVFIVYGIVFSLILIFIVSNSEYKIKKIEFYILSLVIIWLIVVLLYAVYQMPDFSIGNYVYIVLYFLPILFFILSNNHLPSALLNKTFIFIFFCILLNTISNISILSINPFAAKEATGNYGLIDYSQSNVITDTFIFSYVIFLYLLISIWKLNKKNILIFIAITLITIMIIQSTFFIAISTLLIMISIKIMSSGKGKSKKIIKYFLFVFIISIFLIFKRTILETITLLTSLFTDNYIILHRIEASVTLLTNFSAIGTLGARLEDLKISFWTFVEHPIFGKGFIVSDYIQESGIGMHSHIFDTLARFGAVGFLIEFSIYITFYIYTKNLISKKYSKDYLIIYIGFFWYALFNPIVYPAAGMIMFLIVPYVLKGVEKNNDEEKKNSNVNHTVRI